MTDEHAEAAVEEMSGAGETSGTAPAAPSTGDRAVDEAIALVTGARHDGPIERVAALTEAHRRLQARLTSPPPDPRESRPGPPRP